MLARLGVLLLLFEVGLESTVAQMLKVGLSSLLVAILGVVAPFALGWGVGAWLLPGAARYVHAFLGATLSATSVGITARVLQDLGRSQSTEARIILGAAVIDDVLGLVILAVVSGVIAARRPRRLALRRRGGAHPRQGGRLPRRRRSCSGCCLSPEAVSPRLAAAGRAACCSPLGLAFCFLLSWLAGSDRPGAHRRRLRRRPRPGGRSTTATSSTAASTRWRS